MKLTHWNTWKKKNNPEMREMKDSTLGFIETVRPTMKHHGFAFTYAEREEGIKPKEQATDMLPDGVTEAVYRVWDHSRGYCSYLEIFYKPDPRKINLKSGQP